MKTPARFALMLAFLVLGSVMTHAAEAMRVQSSRDLRVLVIDESKHDAARATVHKAFAASISASLQRQCGEPVGVRIVEQNDVRQAAEDLKAGIYDAALIFGSALPSDLRSSDFRVTRASSPVGVPVRVFNLVVSKGDPSLSQMLVSAFNDTLETARFQEALYRSVAVRVIASNLP